MTECRALLISVPEAGDALAGGPLDSSAAGSLPAVVVDLIDRLENVSDGRKNAV